MSAKTGIEGKPHRFLTFQEQLSKIEIKFSRQDGSLDRFAENAATKSGSHFSDACLQWRETNLSQEYSDFCREVYNISGDLALLVLNQKTVVDILIRYLIKHGSLAHEPLLDLTVQLARDLRDDFYNHFPEVVRALFEVVSPSSKQSVPSETIENTFRALTCCFKFLRKSLLRDLDAFYGVYAFTFGPGHPVHVRMFAAESYAYLLRKYPVDKLEGHLDTIFRTLVVNTEPEQREISDGSPVESGVQTASTEMIESVAHLIGQVVCHVCHKYHSRLQSVLDACFSRLTQRYHHQLGLVLDRSMVMMVEHTRPRFADHLWECVLKSLDDVAQRWITRFQASSAAISALPPKKQKKSKRTGAGTDTAETSAARALSSAMHAVTLAAEHRDGGCVTHLLVGAGLEIARRLLECSTVDRKIPSAVHSATVRFVSTFAYAKQLADADAKTTTAEDLYDDDEPAVSINDVLAVVLLHGEHRCGVVYDVGTDIVEHADYNAECARAIMKFAIDVVSRAVTADSTEKTQTPKRSIKTETKAAPKHDGSLSMISDERTLQSLLFLTDFTAKVDVTTLIPVDLSRELQSLLVAILTRAHSAGKSAETAHAVAVTWACLLVMSRLFVPDETACAAVVRVLESTPAAINAMEDGEDDVEMRDVGVGTGDGGVGKGDACVLTRAHGLYVVAGAIHALASTADGDDLVRHAAFVTTFVVAHNSSAHVLRAAEVYFKHVARAFPFVSAGKAAPPPAVFSPTTLEHMLATLRENIGAKCAATRRASLGILHVFANNMRDVDGAAGALSVSELRQCAELLHRCYRIETTEVTMTDFRDRKMLMTSLGGEAYVTNMAPTLQDIPVRYLLAALTVSFAPLWTSAKELLVQYATHCPEVLWPHVHADLTTACVRARDESRRLGLEPRRRVLSDAEVVKEVLDEHRARHRARPGMVDTGNDGSHPREADNGTGYGTNASVWGAFVGSMGHDDESTGRIDVMKWHENLCNVLTDVPILTEKHNRDIVTLFLHFMDEEYDRVFVGTAQTQDLTDPTAAIAVDDDEDATDDKEATTAAPADGTALGVASDIVTDFSRSGATGAFVSRKELGVRLRNFLSIFATFKNPSQCYENERVANVFHDLLKRWDQRSQTQVAALACILQYKHKHINPYAKPLQKIVEERSDFKDTLLKFSLDTSAGIVQEEHRRGVVDFLGRVLMGKMMVRQRRGKGHTNPKARRRLILRFFSMGPKEELSTFLHMLIEPFSTSVDMDTLPNAAAVTPLKKQLGFLNLVTDILGNMGSGGAEDMYELALRIVLRMVYDADHLLRSRHDVLPAHVGVLKSIRLIGTKRVCDLLLARPRSYKLGSLQPALDRMVLARPLAALHTESTQTPSAFLNLVLACSGDASLHSVLQGCGDTILPRVFELLSVAKTTESVLTVVLTIAENLLRSSDEKDADATLADLSSQVVAPHIKVLLEHLPGAVTRFVQGLLQKDKAKELIAVVRDRDQHKRMTSQKKTKSSSSNFLALQFSVLALVTPFATNAELSTSLIDLLLPFLARPGKEVPERNKALILKTACSTARNFGFDLKHYTMLSELFSFLWSPYLRKLLGDLFTIMAEQHTSEMGVVGGLMQDLNALSTKHVDEDIDYDRRTAAFARINGDGHKTLTPFQLLPVVHNYVHYLQLVDVSMRSNAVHGLQEMLTHWSANVDVDVLRTRPWDQRDHAPVKDPALLEATPTSTHEALVFGTVLPAVQQGMRHPKAITRQQFLVLLEQLVASNFHHGSVLLSGLGGLRCSDNEDKDFFLNIRHIQAHRQLRAVRQAVVAVQAGDIPRRVLLETLLPLIGHYLFEVTSDSSHSLADEAIVFVGAVCTTLPWRAYSGVLRKYVKLLGQRRENSKILLRTVLSVLNSFHFTVPDTCVVASNARRWQGTRSTSGNAKDSKEETDKADVDDEKSIADPAADAGIGASIADGDGATVVENAEADEAENSDEEEDEQDALVIDAADASEDTEDLVALGTEILNDVTKFFIPKLYRYLMAKRIGSKGETKLVMQADVALAIVHLLHKMPTRVLDSKLPQLLTKLTGVLRDRLESARDGARNCLGDIAVVLGARYVPVIVHELRNGLMRGFQLHVLGYTVHHILNRVCTSDRGCPPGSLDSGVDDFVAIFIDDIFGAVSEEKDVVELSKKTKETRRSMSYESFTKLARVLTPSIMSTGILVPLKDAMSTSESAPITKKFADITRCLVAGIIANELFTPVELITWSQGLITDNMALSQQGKIKASGVKAMKESIYILAPTKRRDRTPDACFNTNAHLLVEMGLALVLARCKRGSLDYSGDVAIRTALNDLVPALLDGLHSKYNRILILSLKVFALLLQQCGRPADVALPSSAPMDPAPMDPAAAASSASSVKDEDQDSGGRQRAIIYGSKKGGDNGRGSGHRGKKGRGNGSAHSEKRGDALSEIDALCTIPRAKAATSHVTSRVFKLIRRSGASAASMELNQACFHVAAVIVRDCMWQPLTQAQVKVLLSFIEMDLDATNKQRNAFLVLKSIIKRQVVVAEVYDIMDSVLELMVRSPSPVTRRLSQQVVLPFLLDYPTGKKRLDKTINFLVSNLGFELEGGKRSALEMLESVLVKFPDAIIEEYAQLFFVSVAKEMINLQAPALRELAGDVIKVLLERVGVAQQDAMLVMLTAWLTHDNKDVRRVAVQVTGLCVDAFGKKGFARHVSSTVQLIAAVVVECAPPKDSEDSEEESAAPVAWELLYMALVVLAKIYKTFTATLAESIATSSTSGDATAHGVWSAVHASLLHPHAWCRLAAARLFGIYFSACDDATLPTSADGYIGDDNVLFTLGKSFCRQLEGVHVTAQMADQLTKNMFFVGKRLLVVFKANNEMATAATHAVKRPRGGKRVPANARHDSGSTSEASGTAAKAALDEGDSEESDGGNYDPDVTSAKSGLVWTFRQMAFVGHYEVTTRPKEYHRRDCVFKWFAAMVSHFRDRAVVQFFLAFMLDPLYRTEENDDGAPEAKELGTQVQDLLKRAAGADAYFEALNKARDKVATIRLTRKRDRKQEAVRDPTKFAGRKIKKNLKKRDQRKRKIMEKRDFEGRSKQRRT